MFIISLQFVFLKKKHFCYSPHLFYFSCWNKHGIVLIWRKCPKSWWDLLKYTLGIEKYSGDPGTLHQKLGLIPVCVGWLLEVLFIPSPNNVILEGLWNNTALGRMSFSKATQRFSTTLKFPTVWICIQGSTQMWEKIFSLQAEELLSVHFTNFLTNFFLVGISCIRLYTTLLGSHTYHKVRQVIICSFCKTFLFPWMPFWWNRCLQASTSQRTATARYSIFFWRKGITLMEGVTIIKEHFLACFYYCCL